jgi:hypothetical protein
MAIRISRKLAATAAEVAYEFGPSKRDWSLLDERAKEVCTEQAIMVIRKYDELRNKA